MLNITTTINQNTSEVVLWKNRIQTAGGVFEWNSIAIANNFIRQLKIKSYYRKIIYLLPLLGKGLIAARVPLIDTLNVGIAGNSNFVDSDFSQNNGLQGDGATKLLNTSITPSQLGNFVGGIGYWENNISFTGTDTVPFGCYSSNTLIRWFLDLRPASGRITWGLNTNSAINASAAINGHYYGQSISNSDRKLYFNGIQVASNTSTDGSTLESSAPITLLGTTTNSAGNWAGRCAIAYLTDGTLTSDEISDLNTLLKAFVLGPSGKPQS